MALRAGAIAESKRSTVSVIRAVDESFGYSSLKAEQESTLEAFVSG